MASDQEPGKISLKEFTNYVKLREKKNFADLDFYFCLIIVGEFQMQPKGARGFLNSTFAGNIK